MYDEWVPQEIIFDYETDVIAAAERTCGPADSASRIYLVSGYYSDYGYVSEYVREPGMDLQFNGISTSKLWADFLNSLSYQFRDADIKSQEQMVADAYVTNQLPTGDGSASFIHGSLIEFTPGQVSAERIVEALYNLLVYRATFDMPKFNAQAVLEFLEKEK